MILPPSARFARDTYKSDACTNAGNERYDVLIRVFNKLRIKATPKQLKAALKDMYAEGLPHRIDDNSVIQNLISHWGPTAVQMMCSFCKNSIAMMTNLMISRDVVALPQDSDDSLWTMVHRAARYLTGNPVFKTVG